MPRGASARTRRRMNWSVTAGCRPANRTSRASAMGAENVGQQRVVVGMDLEQRLRTQQQHAIAPAGRAPRGRGLRARRRDVRSGCRCRAGSTSALGVLRARVLGLHRRAAQEGVDRRMPGGDRVPPCAVLARREPQCGEGERARVHAELGIDEHVQPVTAHRGRDARRPGVAAAEGAKDFGTGSDRAAPPRPCRAKDGRRTPRTARAAAR